MENKFKKYWQKIQPLYGVAIVIDPSVKVQGVEWLLKSVAEHVQKFER